MTRDEVYVLLVEDSIKRLSSSRPLPKGERTALESTNEDTMKLLLSLLKSSNGGNQSPNIL
jgi:hypothetical protein